MSVPNSAAEYEMLGRIAAWCEAGVISEQCFNRAKFELLHAIKDLQKTADEKKFDNSEK